MLANPAIVWFIFPDCFLGRYSRPLEYAAWFQPAQFAPLTARSFRYFGSLTALKNGLTTNKGECDVNDQVNPITVPALVLAGGENPMRSFGARVGDLVIAFNPRTNLFVPAIIGDSGPANNLGEGSILLNMKLLGQTVPPTNKAETFRLSIEDDGSDYSWFTFVSTRKALHG